MRDFKKRTVSAILAGACLLTPCVYAVPAHGLTAYAENSDQKGTDGDYVYQTYNQGDKGTIDYENTQNNGFSCSWDKVWYSSFYKGKAFEGDTVYPRNFGDYYVSYDADVNFGETSSLSVTGELNSSNKTVIFHILEAWTARKPYSTDNIQPVTTFESEGSTYEVYISYDPSIGLRSTVNLWCIKTDSEIKIGEDTHLSGKINIKDHFKAWKEADLIEGSLLDIGLTVDGYESTGKADINSLEIGGIIDQDVPSEEFTKDYDYSAPTNSLSEHIIPNQLYPLFTFDNTDTLHLDVKYSEDTKGTLDNSIRSSGDQSWKLSSDKKDSERSVMIDFDAGSFINKTTIELGLVAFQDQAEEAKVSIDFQVFPYNSEPVTMNLATKTIKKGKWTTIGNNDFLNPEKIDAYKYRIIIRSDKDINIDDLLFDSYTLPFPKKVYGTGNYSNTSEKSYYIRRSSFKGYEYEAWSDDYSGDCDILNSDNNGFIAEWTNIRDAHFRKGLKPDNTLSSDDLKDYRVTYDADLTFGENDWLEVYGDMTDSDVKFHIVDAYGDWRPLGNEKSLGTVTSNGKKYDIYKSTHIDSKNGEPLKTHEEFWSVATETTVKTNIPSGVSNSVCLGDHLKAWESCGMKPGNVNSIMLGIESYMSSGTAKVKSLEIGAETDQFSEPLAGDINKDGCIDVFDIILCRKALLDQLNGKKERYSADVNGDGKFNVSDLVTLSNFVSGKKHK